VAARLEGLSFFFPALNEEDNVAPIVDEALGVLPRFADSTEFVRWLPQAKGKLVLVSAPQPTCRPTADFTEFATPATRARTDSARAQVAREWSNPNVRGTGYSVALAGGGLARRLDEAGVAGVITSRPTNAVGTRSVFETYNTVSPTLSFSRRPNWLATPITRGGSSVCTWTLTTSESPTTSTSWGSVAGGGGPKHAVSASAASASTTVTEAVFLTRDILPILDRALTAEAV